MPELVHSSSPTRPSAGSLLSAAGTVRVLQPTDAADSYVNDLCARVVLAGVEHQGLRHVHRVEIERQKGTFEDLHRHGRIELSWRTSAGEDAVVSLPGGELALLVGWRGGCEIVVAGGDHVAVRRAADRLVRAFARGRRAATNSSCASGPLIEATRVVGVSTRRRGARSSRTIPATCGGRRESSVSCARRV
jgi:hypothetical protein